MRVVEIFKSIEGEGVRVGLPVTFIRLWGCNLRCSFCDTPYSHTTEEENVITMSIDEVIDKVEALDCSHVTITGGEPLIHPGIEKLIDKLLALGYDINIETNGTMPVVSKYEGTGSIMFTMDYKCPGSGMNKYMKKEVLDTLRPIDVLKFVVGSKEDLDVMVNTIDGLSSRPNVFVSPVFGDITPEEIVNYLLEHNLNNVRVQVQLHKIIWNPDERGV